MKTTPFLLPLVGVNTKNITALKIGLLSPPNRMVIATRCQGDSHSITWQSHPNRHPIAERKKERKKILYARVCAHDPACACVSEGVLIIPQTGFGETTSQTNYRSPSPM